MWQVCVNAASSRPFFGVGGAPSKAIRRRDRFVFEQCRTRQLPVVVAMSGGYASNVDAIVTIHANTIREAISSCQSAFVS